MAADRPTTTWPHRTLRPGQRCVVHTLDVPPASEREVFATTDLLLEAPELDHPGHPDPQRRRRAVAARTLDSGDLERIDVAGLPDLNNDHVLGADPDTMFVSGFDWHIHRVDLASRHVRPGHHRRTGSGRCSTSSTASAPTARSSPSSASSRARRTDRARPTSSPCRRPAARNANSPPGRDRPTGREYSPDGEWIYFNTEAFCDVPATPRSPGCAPTAAT